MNEPKVSSWILVFGLVGWLGFLSMTVPGLTSQLFPEACPAKRANTYALFVQHRWGVNYSYLNELSQLRSWNIVKKCKLPTTAYDVSMKITRTVTLVGTHIGPFSDFNEANTALGEITEKVKLNRCKPDTADNPFIVTNP